MWCGCPGHAAALGWLCTDTKFSSLCGDGKATVQCRSDRICTWTGYVDQVLDCASIVHMRAGAAYLLDRRSAKQPARSYVPESGPRKPSSNFTMTTIDTKNHSDMIQIRSFTLTSIYIKIKHMWCGCEIIAILIRRILVRFGVTDSFLFFCFLQSACLSGYWLPGFWLQPPRDGSNYLFARHAC